MNPLGGDSHNAGTTQYYRYDDDDRSLTCLSCPQDGRQPVGAVEGFLPNRTLSADGGDFAFATKTSLVSADQNTPGPEGNPLTGTDVYEWRDGRLLLITDGLTNWTADQASVPSVRSISANGRDVLFVVAAQYTPDALDGYQRLYDARVGGGFEFPPPPPPCPLEVCQGTPKGVPEEAAPGTSFFAGPGNVATPTPAPRCRKAAVRRKGRCVPRKHKHAHHRTANHKGRAAR